MAATRVANVAWENDRVLLREIREQVFILEQNVPVELEWDGLDESAEHFIAYIDDEPAGCARLIGGSKIGRMAVLKQYRNQGIGLKLLESIKRYASQKRVTRLTLSAQCHAYEFYLSAGFQASSIPYLDAGITHIDMECRVFSQHEGLIKYKFKEDDERYVSGSGEATKGFIELMLSQTRHTILMNIDNLALDAYRHPEFLQKIKALVKRSRRFKLRVLISHYHPTHNDHPLFRLIARLPTFCEVRISQESLQDLTLFDNSATMEYYQGESVAYFYSKQKTDQLRASFERNWQHAKHTVETRRLTI
jgi:predicted GNAT family N-acyltransferase